MSKSLENANVANWDVGGPLTPTAGWGDVPQLETNNAAIGGPGGIMNQQAQKLLNRTEAIRQALQLADYAALRAYDGPFNSVYVTGHLISAVPLGIAGFFRKVASGTDNGGTVIVGAHEWERVFDGPAMLEWFGCDLTGAIDSTDKANAAFAAHNWVSSGPGTLRISGALSLPGTINSNNSRKFSGPGRNALKIIQSENDTPILRIGNLCEFSGAHLSYSTQQTAANAPSNYPAVTGSSDTSGFYGCRLSDMFFSNTRRGVGNRGSLNPNAYVWGNSFRDIWFNESCTGSSFMLASTGGGQPNNVFSGIYINGAGLDEPPMRLYNGSYDFQGVEFNNILNQPLIYATNCEIAGSYIRFENPAGTDNYTGATQAYLFRFEGVRGFVGAVEMQSLKSSNTAGVALFGANGEGITDFRIGSYTTRGLATTGAAFKFVAVEGGLSSNIRFGVDSYAATDGAATTLTATGKKNAFLCFVAAYRKYAPPKVFNNTSNFSITESDPMTTVLSAAIASNITITLPTTGTIGEVRKIVRQASGAGSVDVGGVVTLPAGSKSWCEIQHNGSGWVATSYGQLP